MIRCVQSVCFFIYRNSIMWTDWLRCFSNMSEKRDGLRLSRMCKRNPLNVFNDQSNMTSSSIGIAAATTNDNSSCLQIHLILDPLLRI